MERASRSLIDQSDTAHRPLFSRWLSERLAGRHRPWLGALTTLRRSALGYHEPTMFPSQAPVASIFEEEKRLRARWDARLCVSNSRLAASNHLSPRSSPRYDRPRGTIREPRPSL